MRERAIVAPADNIIALHVIRSLGRRGVHVTAVTTRPGVASRSRYCARAVASSGETLVDTVLELVKADPGCYLFGLGELEITSLNTRRAELEKHAVLLFPPQDRFELALNKDQTLRIAGEAGVPAPRTVHLAVDPALESCRALAYPVVLKPVHQDIVDFKRLYLDSPDALRDAVEQYREHRDILLVQELAEGVGVGVELLIRSGRVLLAFQHRRLREMPPSGGVSVCCASEPVDPALLAHSVDLLRAMRWDGVAMVEFKQNPATGALALMEVNGRFWGSLPLAVQAGADFPYALLRAYSPRPWSPPSEYRRGMVCRTLIGDTKWLWLTLRGSSAPPLAAVKDYLRSFAPAVRYFTWDWADPIPAVAAVARRLRRLIPGSA